jgi:hypothetical protein
MREGAAAPVTGCAEAAKLRTALAQSVGFTGMVTLHGWCGEFAPHLFVVLTAEEEHF